MLSNLSRDLNLNNGEIGRVHGKAHLLQIQIDKEKIVLIFYRIQQIFTLNKLGSTIRLIIYKQNVPVLSMGNIIRENKFHFLIFCIIVKFYNKNWYYLDFLFGL